MKILFYSLFFCFVTPLFSENDFVVLLKKDSMQLTTPSEMVIVTENYTIEFSEKPSPILQKFRKKQRLNKQITAAVLAFPFPFGIVGLHRIYLGTKPFVPIVYIASLGGIFGILPFIDFCAIIFDKDFDQYRNNGKVFMWIRD